MRHTIEVNHLRESVALDGFATVGCLDFATVESLRRQTENGQHAQRNLLSIAAFRELAASKTVRDLVCSVLGPNCFAVRALFFDKTPTSNWKVPWHQDLTIAVQERRDAEGFGPWTIKAGVQHVQPPTEVMTGMLAMRLHLDDSAPDNGPLRVLPGSHRHGRLSAEQIAALDKGSVVTCSVPSGGALLMRPLLLHASSACDRPKPRRVIHFEFAAQNLPSGLAWHDRV